MLRSLGFVFALLALSPEMPVVMASDDESPVEKPVEKPPAEQDREATPPDPSPGDENKAKITERVVVSASASRVSIRDAPAAVDVLTGEDLEARPSDGVADQLRRVPGLNVVQFSARDVNISSRSASGGINNSTLGLVDGRSIYQDFLGFILWEFAPTDFSLVESVEVVRGPASSLWGANAVGGLVHVVTRSPRETLGGQLTAEAGNYGTLRFELRESFLAGPWALRVSGGTHRSDAFDRPREIENFCGERIDPDLGLIDDDFRDSGTEQPRVDFRADHGDTAGGQWILQGGWGRTRGWIATGLGPFDIDPSTSSSFVQARFLRGPYEAQVDVNFFDGEAVNLINALPFDFRSASTHATFRGRTLLADRGVFGWGIDFNRSVYDLSIAPLAEPRSKAAVFGELDLSLSRRFWLTAGARADYVRETIGTVGSPRVALRFKPSTHHTLRLAWGKAFRSPSIIETDLRVPSIPVAILDWEQIDEEQFGGPGLFTALAAGACAMTADNCGVPPGETPDYIAVLSASGNRDIDEEVTASFEVGYSATLGRFTVSAAAYRTRSRDGISFLQQSAYGFGFDGVPGTADDILFPTDPDGDGIDEAPPIDVCPAGLDSFDIFDELCLVGPVPYNQALSIFLDGLVPSGFRYENGASAENRGVELGGSWAGPRDVSLSASYSWQDDPRSDGVRMSDRIDSVRADKQAGREPDPADLNAFINIPARHRIGLSAQVVKPRWSASATFDFVDRTFWQDVLTDDFWGYVSSYSLVGLRGEYRFPGRNLGLSGQITNLLGEEIQQHIYGDLIGRRANLAMTWSWGPQNERSANRE